MLDNDFSKKTIGVSRYEFIVYKRENIEEIFRTDDFPSISLVKSFAEFFISKQENSSIYSIEYRDNNKLIDRKIRDTYSRNGIE